MEDPSLNDLVDSHRAGVHLTDEQRVRGRTRIIARVGAGAALSTLAVGAAARSTTHGAALLIAKFVVGFALAGGAGGAYYLHRVGASAGSSTATKGQENAAHQAAESLPGIESQSPLAAGEPSALASTPGFTQPKATLATAKSSPPKTSAHAAKPGSLADEVKTMQEVDGALRSGDSSRALSLLDERPPPETGGMAEERAAARVFILCKSGRVDDARAAAARFVVEWPRSPLAERVRSTCRASTSLAPLAK